jgi:hypothetical protein
MTLEESGLIEALQKLVERSNVPGRLRCNFHSTGVPEESLPPSVQQDLLLIGGSPISLTTSSIPMRSAAKGAKTSQSYHFGVIEVTALA